MPPLKGIGWAHENLRAARLNKERFDTQSARNLQQNLLWGNLYAFKATTGALLPGWPTAYPKGPSSSSYSDPAVANRVVYVGARNDHGFYAFNATIGALLWSTPTGVPIGWADPVANGLGARLERFLQFLQGPPCPNPFDQRPAKLRRLRGPRCRQREGLLTQEVRSPLNRVNSTVRGAVTVTVNPQAFTQNSWHSQLAPTIPTGSRTLNNGSG